MLRNLFMSSNENYSESGSLCNKIFLKIMKKRKASGGKYGEEYLSKIMLTVYEW